MRVKLNRRGDYAVRAVLCLARAGAGKQLKGPEIAAQMGIPPKYLPQIMGSLARGGLVTGTSGASGGYLLARQPRDVSLLSVIEAAEGALRTDECVLRGGPCHWDDVCVLHEGWRGVQDDLRSSLDRIRFDRLAAHDVALERGEIPTPRDSHRGSRGR